VWAGFVVGASGYLTMQGIVGAIIRAGSCCMVRNVELELRGIMVKAWRGTVFWANGATITAGAAKVCEG
jgi:hypothetical protein